MYQARRQVLEGDKREKPEQENIQNCYKMCEIVIKMCHKKILQSSENQPEVREIITAVRAEFDATYKDPIIESLQIFTKDLQPTMLPVRLHPNYQKIDRNLPVSIGVVVKHCGFKVQGNRTVLCSPNILYPIEQAYLDKFHLRFLGALTPLNSEGQGQSVKSAHDMMTFDVLSGLITHEEVRLVTVVDNKGYLMGASKNDTTVRIFPNSSGNYMITEKMVFTPFLTIGTGNGEVERFYWKSLPVVVVNGEPANPLLDKDAEGKFVTPFQSLHESLEDAVQEISRRLAEIQL